MEKKVEIRPTRPVLINPKRKSGLSPRLKYHRREKPFGGKSKTEVGLNEENTTRMVGIVKNKVMEQMINPIVNRLQ